jgi:hypothetical protein
MLKSEHALLASWPGWPSCKRGCGSTYTTFSVGHATWTCCNMSSSSTMISAKVGRASGSSLQHCRISFDNLGWTLAGMSKRNPCSVWIVIKNNKIWYSTVQIWEPSQYWTQKFIPALHLMQLARASSCHMGPMVQLRLHVTFNKKTYIQMTQQ